MKALVVLLALSFQVRADELSDQHDRIMGTTPSLELVQPLDIPEYRPEPRREYLQESDADWTRSVQQLDLERLPRR